MVRVVWSEGVGVCWSEPMLQGSPAPLVRFSNVLYVPQLASNLLSLFTLTALGLYLHWHWSLPCLQQRWSSGAIALDINTKEPAGRPKVTQLEVPLQLCFYVLDALLRLANDMAVIYICWHNHLPTSAVLP